MEVGTDADVGAFEPSMRDAREADDEWHFSPVAVGPSLYCRHPAGFCWVDLVSNGVDPCCSDASPGCPYRQELRER